MTIENRVVPSCLCYINHICNVMDYTQGRDRML